VGSNITEALFRARHNGAALATVRGFGAVFTDVDEPDGVGPGKKRANLVEPALVESLMSTAN